MGIWLSALWQLVSKLGSFLKLANLIWLFIGHSAGLDNSRKQLLSVISPTSFSVVPCHCSAFISCVVVCWDNVRGIPEPWWTSTSQSLYSCLASLREFRYPSIANCHLTRGKWVKSFGYLYWLHKRNTYKDDICLRHGNGQCYISDGSKQSDIEAMGRFF